MIQAYKLTKGVIKMDRKKTRKAKKGQAKRMFKFLIIAGMLSVIVVNSNNIFKFVGTNAQTIDDQSIEGKNKIKDVVLKDEDDIMFEGNESISKNQGNLQKYSLEGTTYLDENNKKIIKNIDSKLVLVNKERNLPSDYIPEDLIVPNVPFSFEGDDPKKKIIKEAADALESLFQAGKKDNVDLFAVSGYRSYKRQKAIFDWRASRHGEEVVNQTTAYPGQSEHQTGLAMDVTCHDVRYELTQKFGETKEGKWLKENAHKYGFIIRYPKGKEEITGYSYEPWHIRYVGKEVSQSIYKNNITLEEFFYSINE